jgi:hypothetical protein
MSRRVGYAPQVPRRFRKTLEENILLGVRAVPQWPPLRFTQAYWRATWPA